jgi:hypothetical protein
MNKKEYCMIEAKRKQIELEYCYNALVFAMIEVLGGCSFSTAQRRIVTYAEGRVDK